MVFTVFDIFMARSLRSLAGVLYGGVWEIWGGNHIFTTTLKYQKKFPHFHTAVLQYSKYSRYPKKSAILSVFAVFAIFPCYLGNFQYLQYSLVPGKFPVFIIYQKYVMIFSKIDNLGILFLDQKK